MSLNAAMIQAMVDKGLSGQDIADIAKAGEVKVDRTAAERQARHRSKTRGKRNAVTSRRDPLIEEYHNPGSEISSDDEIQNNAIAVRDADWPEFPDWLPAEPWNAFLKMRGDKGGWPSAYAVGLLLGKLEKWRAKGHDPTDVLNTSTECNWTGLFEPKEPKNGQRAFNQRPTTRQSGERVAARYAAAGGSAAHLLPRPGSAGGDA